MTADPTKWFDEPESKPAPGPLRDIQALVNTVDRESGADRLADAAGATEWLATQQVISSISSDERRQLIDVREAFRAMLLHNAGGPAPAEDARRVLQDVAATGAAQVTIHDDGSVGVIAAGASVQAYLTGLLLVVRDAQRDGTWSHLKACGNDDCQWAFYDRSRNHGGTWCDMKACGNKLKNRDFRARQRKAPAQ